jgi:hypothetical protein
LNDLPPNIIRNPIPHPAGPGRFVFQSLGARPPASVHPISWLDRYAAGGLDGLEDRKPRPRRVWNRIDEEVRRQVIALALDEPELSAREVAVAFTDRQRCYVSTDTPHLLDLLVAYATVSRRHARLSLTGDALQAEDLGSTNGTAISGEPATLYAGNKLKLGDVDLMVRQL